MARYLLLALNGPTNADGDEDALNRWYESDHLPAFKKIQGIKSARRYKVLQGRVPGLAEIWPYVAVYEIETPDLAAVSAQLAATMQEFHPALDRTKSAFIRAIQIAGDDL
jgi:hypothetical protein